jgi:hypothetical protein
MKTNKILIAFFFPFLFVACSTSNNDSKLTPITRWALAVNARVHPPPSYEPDDSYEKIVTQWSAIVKADMNIAWQLAHRPDKIEDSTVLELTGQYVKSDSLPDVFTRHMAALDVAENAQENYLIDYSRQYASDPSYWVHKPVTEHSANEHVMELTALRTALELHRQVTEMNEVAER